VGTASRRRRGETAGARRIGVVLPLAILAVLASVTTVAPRARADEATAAVCVAEADRGQKERDDGHLVAARATLLRCSEERCPGPVRRECLRWVGQIEERLPTVVLGARDGATGKDLVDAEISVDGQTLPAGSAGRELPVDPGSHALRATRAGYAPRDEMVTVRERERGRSIALPLTPRGDPSAAPAAPLPPVPRGDAPKGERRRVPVAVPWILGGVAVLGGAGFAWFWNDTMGQVGDLRGSCAPSCSSAQIDDVRPSMTAAHVSLGVGIAAAVATVVVLLLPSGSAASVSSASAADRRAR